MSFADSSTVGASETKQSRDREGAVDFDRSLTVAALTFGAEPISMNNEELSVAVRDDCRQAPQRDAAVDATHDVVGLAGGVVALPGQRPTLIPAGSFRPGDHAISAWRNGDGWMFPILDMAGNLLRRRGAG